MSERTKDIIVLICILFQTGVCLFVGHQRDKMRKEAVQHGFAEWVADDYGRTTFTWKEVKK